MNPKLGFDWSTSVDKMTNLKLDSDWLTGVYEMHRGHIALRQTIVRHVLNEQHET